MVTLLTCITFCTRSPMTDNGAAGSQQAGPSSAPKAIGSLAKKQSDVTRQGTQRLKFVPTLPARRKKEEVKQEAPTENVQATPPARGDGRGRGRGRGRGGETRGAAPRPAQTEMIASGPFAMGPALAGTSARRTAPRSNFTAIVPLGPATGASLGSNLSNTPAPQLKRDKQHVNLLESTAEKQSKRESDEEIYSEPDEGVEIVDMEDVGKLDWMAPETVQAQRREQKRKKLEKAEVDESSIPSESKGKGREVTKDMDIAGAVDPSESEEIELEDLIEDFAFQANIGQEVGVRQERIYLFQFPDPFFTFVSNVAPLSATPMDTDTPEPGPSDARQRRVSFAADVKPPAPMTTTSAMAPANDAPTQKESPKVDGIIGQLEVYRSGAVKMRLGNDILLDVSGATQPSFLQQAVHLDMDHKQLHVLGEVNKRFVVSPDVSTLLAAMEAEDTVNAMNLDDSNLIRMDP